MSLVLSQTPDCFILQCFLKRRTLLRKTCISPSIHWNRSPLFRGLMPALPLVHHRRHRTIQVLQLNSSGLEMVMFNICHFKHPRARLHHLPNSVLHICISPEAAAWLFSCHGIMITITFLDYLKHSLEGLDGNS